MAKLNVDIVTVEGRRFQGEADFVVAPGSEGQLGILPHHIPLLTPLATGSVKVRNNNEEQFFFVSGGFLEVRPDRVPFLPALPGGEKASANSGPERVGGEAKTLSGRGSSGALPRARLVRLPRPTFG